nr:MAG TPA: hypothetical protein [Caudoviricetes sp.]
MEKTRTEINNIYAKNVEKALFPLLLQLFKKYHGIRIKRRLFGLL